MKQSAAAGIAAWLLVVACGGCSTPPEQQAVEGITQLGGKVKTDSQGRVIEVDLSRTKAKDSDLALLGPLPTLQSLNLSDTQVKSLDALPVLADLHTLFLGGTQINDAALANIALLTSLHTLHLGRTQVTDAGLPPLRDMTHLRTLALGDTLVSDAGLASLRNLRELSTLVVRHTKVTPAGVEALRRSLPDTRIDR